MRDPRFPAPSMFWIKLIAHARLVNGEIWLNPLVEHLQLALRQSGCFENGVELSPLSSNLSTQLIALRSSEIIVPEEIVKALDSAFDSRAENVTTAQAAWCWGLALGRCALEVTTARDLRSLLDKGSHDFIMLEAFLECTALLLNNHNPAIVKAVEESIETLVRNPNSSVLGRRGEGYSELLDDWRNKPPYEAFDLTTLSYVPIYYEFLGLIQHLRMIDRTTYLSWLDRLGNPCLVEDAFANSEVLEDFDELLALLQSAQHTYADEENDRWISMVAPILLETALHHCQTLLVPFERPERDEEAYKQVCTDLSQRMDHLAQTLAQRIEGARLAAHWLMRLVRMNTQLKDWRSLPASMAIQALAHIFGDSEVNAAGVIQWLPPIVKLSPDEQNELMLSGLGLDSTGLTPKMDILIVRILMKAFREDSKSFEEELQTLNNLLLMRDAGAFTDPSLSGLKTWRHELVGCVFTGPDPVGTWKKCWIALEEQRRRKRHTAFTSDHSADDPSLFLCATALSLLEGNGDAVRIAHAESLKLWIVVYESAWSMTLLYDDQSEGEIWRYLLTLLMRTMPRHLDLESDSGADRLSDLLASLAGDEELIVHSVGRLFQAGCSSKSLMDALTRTGVELRSILDQLGPYSSDVTIYPLMRRWGDALLTCRELLRLERDT